MPPMRGRLDSSLPDDAGWTVPPFVAGRVLRGTSSGATLTEAGSVVRRWDDPLAAMAWLDAGRRDAARWVGYFAYELGRLFEPSAAHSPVTSEGTLFEWGEVDRAGSGEAASAAGRRADTGLPPPKRPRPPTPLSTFTRAAYLRAVARCVDYVAAGDIFQVNLSQTFTLPFAGTADALYAALLDRSPAAYGGLLDLGDRAIVCNSPELFLRVTSDRRVVTRPIKGTRPLGRADELMRSDKDAAELNMIVDLERNDLGRVCEVGSVRVTQHRTVETHPTLHHGVAEVQGQLRGDVGLVELLAATFPGGSITGAPKIRAMQIIDELEPVPRGPYCGAIGVLDPDGGLQLNVAIRTATLSGGLLRVPVGGGIVADSDPAAEYDETLVKARAILDAVRAAGSQRDPGPASGPPAGAGPGPRCDPAVRVG